MGHMSPVASIAAADVDTVCADCGYALMGLAEAGNCPECGTPIAQSHRRPSPFEVAPSAGSFVRTTLAVVAHPSKFYRSLATRPLSRRARSFARSQWGIASVLFSVALSGQVMLDQTYTARWDGWPYWPHESRLFEILLAPFAAIIYGLIAIITRVVAKIAASKAADAGMRLPRPVVLRGLYFHSAHYVPIAFLAASTVCGYIGLLFGNFLDAPPSPSSLAYGYTLIVVAAFSVAHLCVTYRIAMRNMMCVNESHRPSGLIASTSALRARNE